MEKNDGVTAMKIGFAKRDITPPAGTELGGYAGYRPCAGVHDPSYGGSAGWGDGHETLDVLFQSEAGSVFDNPQLIPQ